jgi:hypothetical protein
MKDKIVLNSAEQRRVLVLNQLEAELAERQGRRLRARYRREWASAVSQGNRGRRPVKAAEEAAGKAKAEYDRRWAIYWSARTAYRDALRRVSGDPTDEEVQAQQELLNGIFDGIAGEPRNRGASLRARGSYREPHALSPPFASTKSVRTRPNGTGL